MPEVSINPAWTARLKEGLSALELQLPIEVSEQLLRLIVLLNKWNRAYNLTAIHDPMEMVDRHLIDSLSILPYLKGKHILDMGTGPGLPGIPLALALPEMHFVLLDSNAKKIRFVRQAVMELGLQNVHPVHTRIENFRPQQRFDTLISRAFTSLPKMLALTESIRGVNTQLLAMKGVVPQHEIEQLATQYQVEIIPLKVPFTQGERHLILISRLS